MAKDRRQGRRRETDMQHVVDLAFAFFERFSVSSIALRSATTPSKTAALTAK